MSYLMTTNLVPVNDLFVVNVLRCVKIDLSLVRHISVNYLATKVDDNFYEFYSGYNLGELIKYDYSFTPIFNKMYVSNVIPLSRYFSSECVCPKKLFQFINDLNSYEIVIVDH